MHAANCDGMPDDVFFPKARDEITTARAKAICAECVVADECLEYAIATGTTDGIFGGLTPAEREGAGTIPLRRRDPRGRSFVAGRGEGIKLLPRRDRCRSCWGPLPERPPGSTGPRPMYCSGRCRALKGSEPPKIAARICDHCGEPFTPHASRRVRHCSTACYRETYAAAKAARNAARLAKQQRRCEVCGGAIEGPAQRTKYCSMRCVRKADALAKKAQRDPRPPRDCEHCGETFRPAAAGYVGKHCSPRCRDAARRARRKSERVSA